METRSEQRSREPGRLGREFEHLFGNLSPARWLPFAGEYPPVNVTRTDEGLVVEALCPGLDRQTLDITVVGEAVTVRCERKPPPDVPDNRYHRRERPCGTFTRSLSLGERLDPDRAEASYTNGILRVQLGRAPETAPKHIPIKG